jgi:hypothetical protein
MKDNQKKYLDKVVDLIVRETIIDYDDDKIKYPYHTFRLPINLQKATFPGSAFSQYCIDTYGLSYDEIEYVWGEYKKILRRYRR